MSLTIPKGTVVYKTYNGVSDVRLLYVPDPKTKKVTKKDFILDNQWNQHGDWICWFAWGTRHAVRANDVIQTDFTADFKRGLPLVKRKP